MPIQNKSSKPANVCDDTCGVDVSATAGSAKIAGFPVVEALLLLPPEGKSGPIGICTNTSAPAEVINEITEENRKNICVLGSLIVSRDGVERMIINSLAHPTLKFLVLFSEESVTFAPSTNLLQAIMDGLDTKRQGNFIKGGVAASPQYPNLNEDILEAFSREVVVVPVFMYTNAKSKPIIKRYLDTIKDKIGETLYELLKKNIEKEKIYFDTLNKVLAELVKLPSSPKNKVSLNPKDFQQLQPPTIELESYAKQIASPFKVSIEKGAIRLDIELGKKRYFIVSNNDFLLSYSLMKFIGKDKKLLSPIQQLALGAELGRVSLELVDKNIETASFIKSEFGKSEAGKTPTKKDKSSKDAKPKKASEAQEIMLEPKIQLAIDKKFYYRISAKDKQVRVLCMAFDACSEFFELVSSEPAPIMERLAKENRFDDYEMDILHRIDIGTQIGRAYVAAKLDYSFVQDLSLVFKINHDHLPFLIADGDSFLDVHKKVLLRIYTEGLTENHGDSWKGLARTAAVLAIYRDADKALSKLPEIYRQGSEDTATMRQEYKKELLRKDHDGTYTYGERTREYFSFDQLDRTIDTLRKNPDSASVIQRFDPSKDMSSYVEEETRKVKYTHDPCLTHDIFFIQDGKLHSFHIARAHNIVNAYPENIFGLHDAYVETVCKGLGLKGGDMYMLSNRANILLITEEQRTKKLLNEPSKPVGEVDTSSGPYLLDKKTKLPKKETGIAFFTMKARANSKKPADPILKKLENYKGQNILQKAVEYLKVRGGMHNNPIVTEYYAGIDDPQKDQLVFFQANVYGNKVYGTAVFANRSLKKKDSDTKLCNYIMTQFSKRLNVPLGELNVIYVRFKK